MKKQVRKFLNPVDKTCSTSICWTARTYRIGPDKRLAADIDVKIGDADGSVFYTIFRDKDMKAVDVLIRELMDFREAAKVVLDKVKKEKANAKSKK